VTWRRTILMGGHGIRHVAHLRVAWALAVAAAGLCIVAGILRDANFAQDEERFLRDAAGVDLACFGSVLAIALVAMLVRPEGNRGFPAVLQTRGLRESEWLGGCLIAVWVSLAALVLLVHAVLDLLLWRFGHPGEWLALSLAAGRDFLPLALTATATLLVGVLIRGSALALTLAVALTMVSRFGPAIVLESGGGHGAGSVTGTLLRSLVPNYSVFESGRPLGPALVAWTGYVAGYFGLAVLAFSGNET
jgi:hypothetical protein